MWSCILAAVTHLNYMEISHKKLVLREHRKAISKMEIDEKLCNIDTVVRAFIYYATSGLTYEKLREDYKLPSRTTLTT